MKRILLAAVFSLALLLGACGGSEEETEKAEETALWYKNLFGEDYTQVIGAGAIGQQWFASITINP